MKYFSQFITVSSALFLFSPTLLAQDVDPAPSAEVISPPTLDQPTADPPAVPALDQPISDQPTIPPTEEPPGVAMATNSDTAAPTSAPMRLRPIIDITPKEESKPRHKNFGFGVDVGLPSGLAVGFAAKPNLPWLRLELAATYNVLAPGIRGGFTLDPLDFGISPSLTIEAGHSFAGNIPSKSAQVDMTYVNFHLGAELGSQQSFRFFIHAGPSYILSHGSNLESLFSGNSSDLKLSNTSVHGWFVPTAQIGMNLFF